MPATPEAVALTNAHRANVLALRQTIAARSASLWTSIDARNVDEGFDAWRSATEALVGGAKRHGAVMADAYLAAFAAAELGTHPQPVGVDSDAYMDTEDGRPLAVALTPPVYTVKAALQAGRGDALRLGMVRATRIVAEEVLAAPRRALFDLIEGDEGSRVAGWTRVTGSNPCGACLAFATGETLPPGERIKRHGHCRCAAEPVMRNVPQTYRRPTGREHFDSLSRPAQDALFHGRGGAEKAELIRTGAVPLKSLAKRDPQVVTADQWTETPMGDLLATTPRPD